MPMQTATAQLAANRRILEALGVPRIPTVEEAVILTGSTVGTYLIEEINKQAFEVAQADADAIRAAGEIQRYANDVADRIAKHEYTDGTWVGQAAGRVVEATNKRREALRTLAQLTYAASKAVVDFS